MKRAITWLEQLSLGVAVVTGILMMLIVSYDAISRYAFNAPLPWAFEIITNYMLIIALYMALSATFTNGDHINIDLFRILMPGWLRARLDTVWGLMSAVAFGLVAYGAWREMMRAIARNAFLPGYFTWPLWVAYLPILIGAGILVLRLVVHSVDLLIFGEDKDVVVHGEPNE
ncbi:MAG: TRAP transporter small permease [Rhodobacteraceae bacterium]|nr:TRAP transporter small permease [Paracoccaceae bacterium]